MATVSGDQVDDTMPVYGSDVDIPASSSANKPDWLAALDEYPVWRALEAEAGEMLTYTEDRIQLSAEAPWQLAGRVYLTSQALLGSHGWNVVGDHCPPLSLQVSR